MEALYENPWHEDDVCEISFAPPEWQVDRDQTFDMYLLDDWEIAEAVRFAKEHHPAQLVVHFEDEQELSRVARDIARELPSHRRGLRPLDGRPGPAA